MSERLAELNLIVWPSLPLWIILCRAKTSVSYLFFLYVKQGQSHRGKQVICCQEAISTCHALRDYCCVGQSPFVFVGPLTRPCIDDKITPTIRAADTHPWWRRWWQRRKRTVGAAKQQKQSHCRQRYESLHTRHADEGRVPRNAQDMRRARLHHCHILR